MSHPISQALLQVGNALQDEIITDSGLKLYFDPSYAKEWAASVTATIAALPAKITNKKDFKIVSQLQVGDEVAISYRVVADFEFEGDGHRFMSTMEDNDLMQSYVNGRGEKIDIVALPGKISKIWVGYFRNKFGEMIDGIQGRQSDVERWKSQFQFGKTDNYKFNNLFEYNKQDYWKCDLSDIFAKKVKGHLIALGDRIICKPVEADVPDEILAHIKHRESVKIRYQDRGRIVSGGKDKGLKKDQIIHFDPVYCEKYEFFGNSYFLIQEKYVEGIWH